MHIATREGIVFFFFAVYNFSCISVCKSPVDGWHVEPKRVAVTGDVCDLICVFLIL